MKRRHIDPADGCDPEDLLLRALAALEGPAELRCFLHDLCTPAELEALRDRWRVVPHLLQGRSYREIHELTGVSVTTIGRVARFLGEGHGGYRIAARRLFGIAAPAERDAEPPAKPARVSDRPDGAKPGSAAVRAPAVAGPARPVEGRR